ncbi:MAG: hypothetical protein ACLRVT_06930, partial [Oscillospiraceae bacterium]
LFYLWVLSVTRKYRPQQGLGKELDDNLHGQKLYPVHANSEKLHFLFFPPYPLMPRGHSISAQSEMEERPAKEGRTPLWYLPLGGSFAHSMSKG